MINLVLLVLAFGWRATAQQTTALCASSFSWMENAFGQSPCLVAAYLQGQCFSNPDWIVDALPAGESYLGPNITQADACECNSVTYSLLAGCAACQNEQWVSYASWLAYCPVSLVRNGSFPSIVPNATIIPPWALLQIPSGTFDVNSAEAAAHPSSSSHTSTGVIIGIVLGVVLLLFVLSAFAYIFLKSRRKRRQLGMHNYGSAYSLVSAAEGKPFYHRWVRRNTRKSQRPPPGFVIDTNDPIIIGNGTSAPSTANSTLDSFKMSPPVTGAFLDHSADSPYTMTSTGSSMSTPSSNAQPRRTTLHSSRSREDTTSGGGRARGNSSASASGHGHITSTISGPLSESDVDDRPTPGDPSFRTVSPPPLVPKTLPPQLLFPGSVRAAGYTPGAQ